MAAEPGRTAFMGFEPLESRVMLAGDLTIALGSLAALPATLLPGDKLAVPVAIANNSGVPLKGKVTVRLLASTDNVADDNDVDLTPDAGITSKISLAIGATKNFNIKGQLAVDPAKLPAGDYFLIATVEPTPGGGLDGKSGGSTASPGALPLAYRFGTFDLRKKAALTLLDSNGTLVTFTLSGNGSGVVAASNDGESFGITLTGADEKSKLSVKTKKSRLPLGVTDDGLAKIDSITTNSPLAAITASTSDLLGDVLVNGPLGALALHDVLATNSGHHTIQTGPSANPKFVTKITLGDIADLDIDSGTAVSLTALRWLDAGGETDGIHAPALTGLSIKGNKKASLPGDFEADLTLTGNLGKTTIARNAGGNWRIGGIVDAVTIAGNAEALDVRVKTNPVDNLFDNGNDTLDPLGSVKAFTLGGVFSDDSVIMAGKFPRKVSLAKVKVDPLTNPHFLNHARDIVPPTVSAQLEEDTGLSATDGITSSAEVAGTVADFSSITSLVAGFGDTPTVSILDELSNGAFSLDATDLADINGGALADGTHRLRLLATDAAGNMSSFFDLNFTLDTTAPAGPTLTLAPDSDTGTLGDNLTADATVTLQGDTEPNAVVTLVGRDRTATADGAGRFTFDNIDLIPGGNTFTVRATDAAGNSSSFTDSIGRETDPNGLIATATIASQLVAPNTYRYTITLNNTGGTDIGTFWYAWIAPPTEQDYLPVEPTVTNSPAGWIFEVSGGDPPSQDAPLGNGFSIEWIATSNALAPGNSFDTFEFETSAAPAQVFGNSPFYPSTPIGRSVVYIGLAFTDPGYEFDVVADTSSSPVVTAQLDNDTGTSTTDKITNDPTLSGSVVDPDGIQSFLAGFDSQPPAFDITDALNPDGTFTLDAAKLELVNGAPLPDGTLTLHLLAVDNNGHASNVFDFTFTLDTTAPNGTTPDLAAASDSGVSSTDDLTNDNTPTFTGAATPGATVTVKSDNASLGTTTADGGGAWTFTATTLADGAHEIVAEYSDAAGNSDASAPLTITIDTAAPATPTLDLDLASDTGTPGDNSTGDAVVTLVGTTDPDTAVTLVQTAADTVSDATGDFQFTSVSLDAGINVFTVRATDDAGNTATGFAAITREVAGLHATATLASQQINPSTYHYTITLHNDGSTNIGTFWFSWTLDGNFMPTEPSNITSPTNWFGSSTNNGVGDGWGIAWVTFNAALAPGQSLSLFEFDSGTTPSEMAGDSPFHTGISVGRSFVYVTTPGGTGYEFDVTV